ncbi:MAG: hypothetical protein ABI600_03455 [Luteolibacter sp.]
MDYFSNETATQTLPKKKNRLSQLIVRLGLGAFTIAVVVHVIGILLAVFVFYKWVFPVAEDPLSPPGGGGRSGGQMVHNIKPTKNPVMSTSVLSNRIRSTSKNPEVSLPDSSTEMMNAALPMTVNTTALGVGRDGIGRDGNSDRPGPGHHNGPKNGGLEQTSIAQLIPTIMKGRCSDSERLKMVQEAGGTPAVEAAVKKSLQWLKECQNPDGSWGNKNQVAMTGLTLLCYLGHCEGTQSLEYGENVTKGMTYLINVGLKNNGSLSNNTTANSWPYEHAIATYALAETLTFSRALPFQVPELETTVEKAIKVITDGQTKEGGWDYKYADSGRNDLSVVGWQMQALKAAKASNVKIDNYNNVIRKAMDWIGDKKGGAYVGDGRFAYTGKNARPGMTAVAALCLQQHGKGNSASVKESVKLIMDGLEMRDGRSKPKDEFSSDYAMQYMGSNFNIYASYYAVQVMRNAGGKHWDAMNDAIIAEILPAQNPDGSFKPEVGGKGGESSSAGGPIYLQALNTLMLEVYYRFLPTSAGNGRRSALDEFH